LNFAFLNELRESPEDHPVLLTELPITNEESRRNYCKLFFESFNTSALTTKTSSNLNLFASGRTSGIVLDCGEGLTWATPMFEGFTFPHAILSSDCAGGEVTDLLMNKLRNGKSGSGFYSSTDRELVKTVKENMCYVHPETFEMKKKRKVSKSTSTRNKKDFSEKLKALEPEFKRLDNEKKMLDDEELVQEIVF
jgi:actin-related protein